MVVCVCHGVRCSEVRAVIRRGATTVEAVGVACGAGTDCGSCRGCIADLIEEVVAEGGVVARDDLGRTHLSVRRTAA